MMTKNPEVMEKLMMSNPQVKKLMESNPQLRQALKDPKTLQQMMEMSTNPKLYQEAMRGHDRALSNLENIPQGFQYLARMQHSLGQAEMAGERKVRTEVTGSEAGKGLTNEPFPNPWEKKKTRIPRDEQLERIKQRIEMHQKAANISEAELVLDSLAQDLTIEEEPTESTLPKSLPHSPALLPRSQSADPLLSTDLSHYEARYDQQLQAMQEMGFMDKNENIRALLSSGGNVSSAIQWLINRDLSK